MFDDPFDDKSDLQREILRVHDRNPDMSNSQIASKCRCSTSYVSKTIKEYRGGSSLLDF